MPPPAVWVLQLLLLGPGSDGHERLDPKVTWATAAECLSSWSTARTQWAEVGITVVGACVQKKDAIP